MATNIITTLRTAPVKPPTDWSGYKISFKEAPLPNGGTEVAIHKLVASGGFGSVYTCSVVAKKSPTTTTTPTTTASAPPPASTSRHGGGGGDDDDDDDAADPLSMSTTLSSTAMAHARATGFGGAPSLSASYSSPHLLLPSTSLCIKIPHKADDKSVQHEANVAAACYAGVPGLELAVPEVRAAKYSGFFTDTNFHSLAVMEFTPFGTLRTLAERFLITPANFEALAVCLCRNLVRIHKSGFIHRDVSACNVLVFNIKKNQQSKSDAAQTGGSGDKKQKTDNNNNCSSSGGSFDMIEDFAASGPASTTTSSVATATSTKQNNISAADSSKQINQNHDNTIDLQLAISDFGIAIPLDGQDGLCCGKPGFIAPEGLVAAAAPNQQQQQQQAPPPVFYESSDYYSLGVTLLMLAIWVYDDETTERQEDMYSNWMAKVGDGTSARSNKIGDIINKKIPKNILTLLNGLLLTHPGARAVAATLFIRAHEEEEEIPRNNKNNNNNNVSTTQNRKALRFLFLLDVLTCTQHNWIALYLSILAVHLFFVAPWFAWFFSVPFVVVCVAGLRATPKSVRKTGQTRQIFCGNNNNKNNSSHPSSCSSLSQILQHEFKSWLGWFALLVFGCGYFVAQWSAIEWILYLLPILLYGIVPGVGLQVYRWFAFSFSVDLEPAAGSTPQPLRVVVPEHVVPRCEKCKLRFTEPPLMWDCPRCKTTKTFQTRKSRCRAKGCSLIFPRNCYLCGWMFCRACSGKQIAAGRVFSHTPRLTTNSSSSSYNKDEMVNVCDQCHHRLCAP